MAYQNHIILSLPNYRYGLHSSLVSFGRERQWFIDCERCEPEAVLARLLQDPVDALVCSWPPNLVMRAIEETSVPVIYVGNDDHELDISKISHCSYDNAAIAHLAADHLLERGFQNIAYYSRWPNSLHSIRYKNFCERIAQAGIVVSPIIGSETLHTHVFSSTTKSLVEEYRYLGRCWQHCHDPWRYLLKTIHMPRTSYMLVIIQA